MTVSRSRGEVHVVATPIGNLEDLSPRALRALREASLIACEDTRRTGRLCARFGIRTPRVSLHAHNEAQRVPRLLERLERGETLALVSDAGTPLLSDPGQCLVEAALDAGIRVVPIPGPSAVLAALVASGLPGLPFSCLGFLPRKGSARREALERLQVLPGTLVLFEAPGRVAATLTDLHAVLGARRIAVARELTKRYEEITRGRLGEIEPPRARGEVTLVVEGRPRPEPEARIDPDSLDARIDAGVAEGLGARDLAVRLHRETGISRSAAYRAVLRRRKAED